MHGCCEELIVLILPSVTVVCAYHRYPVRVCLCVILVSIEVLSSDSIRHQSRPLKVKFTLDLLSYGDFGQSPNSLLHFIIPKRTNQHSAHVCGRLAVAVVVSVQST